MAKDLSVLQRDPLWRQACELYKAIRLALSGETTPPAQALTPLMQRIPRRIAEGILASSVEMRRHCFSDALALARETDTVLHALATALCGRERRLPNDPLFGRLVNAFVLADQLREQLFHAIREEAELGDEAYISVS